MNNIPLGRYRHYKGKEYRVIGIAKHSETEEPMVVYQCLYGDFSLWVRPLDLFTQPVNIHGQNQPRFALLEAENPQEGKAL